MKKILLSVLSIGVLGLVVVYTTNAFFNDTEVSKDNTFVAGALDLKIDSTSHYAGLTCTNGIWVEDVQAVSTRQDLIGDPCDGTWDSKDLTSDKFFNLSDVKPGDEGEDTISMTVENNDAYACILVHNLRNNDNTCTGPEKVAEGGLSCGVDPNSGELAQNLNFTAWLDQGSTLGWQGKQLDSQEGDNVWQSATEPLLFTNSFGPASDVLNGKVYRLADSTNGQKLVGLQTNYVGLRWCAGTMSISGGVISCDGSSMGNNTQTDSVTADLSFYVEQVRNNSTFNCANVPLPTPVIE